MINFKLFVEKIKDLYYSLSYNLQHYKYWISRYRTYDKCHIVDTKLRPGCHDSDVCMLHANFSILVDFIEVKKALMNRPLNQKGSYFKRFRSAELGLQHLDWEICDTHKSQADAAAEQKFLYLWWVDTRPNREDPYELSGYEALVKDSPLVIRDIFANIEDDASIDKKTKLNLLRRKKAIRKCLSRASKIEESNHEEDEKMLIRLMKIRRSLWT